MSGSKPVIVSAFALMMVLGGCGGGDGDPQPIDYYEGEASAALGAANNQATCATCHPNDGNRNGRSGTSMQDIAYRSSYKGGEAATLLDGVNACVTGWMGGTALTAEDDEYIMLEEYLQSISSESVTDPNEIAPEVLANMDAYETDYAGGDASAGEAKYNASCGVCHDAGLVVGSRTPPTTASLASFTIGRIAQKARTSGPPPSAMEDTTDSTPGPMPFFEPSDLSAGDLADIIAFIKAN